MCVVQQRKMENTQNTIPAIRQVGGELQAIAPKKTKVAEAIQPVATISGKPVATTTPRTKNPKRVASGKRLAEHNRRKREEQQQEENSISSQLSSIPNLVSVGTLLLAAYTVYSNRKPAQQQPYTNSNTAKTQQQDESSKYM